MQRRRKSTLQLTETTLTETGHKLWAPRKSHRSWKSKHLWCPVVNGNSAESHSLHLNLWYVCFFSTGSRELFGRLCVCADRGPRVHGERWCQISHRAIRGESYRQRQQKNHIPGAGQGQWSLKAGEGDLTWCLLTEDRYKMFYKIFLGVNDLWMFLCLHL